MNDIEKITNEMFENIKHLDEDGNEYWSARELAKVIGYKDYRNFDSIIDKARISCINSGIALEDHFVDVTEMVDIGSYSKRNVNNSYLSRYACYLVAQNADSRKKSVAIAQTYFAIQTRRQELLEANYNKLSEDEKRIYKRNQTRKGNYDLNKTAVKSGVKDLARFHNAGYKGLHNGETADDIAKRKKLGYREDILDNMCTDELILNLFRISQTNQKLKKSNITNEYEANLVHYNIGLHIRKFIEEEGGTMPEVICAK